MLRVSLRHALGFAGVTMSMLFYWGAFSGSFVHPRFKAGHQQFVGVIGNIDTDQLQEYLGKAYLLRRLDSTDNPAMKTVLKLLSILIYSSSKATELECQIEEHYQTRNDLLKLVSMMTSEQLLIVATNCFVKQLRLDLSVTKGGPGQVIVFAFTNLLNPGGGHNIRVHDDVASALHEAAFLGRVEVKECKEVHSFLTQYDLLEAIKDAIGGSRGTVMGGSEYIEWYYLESVAMTRSWIATEVASITGAQAIFDNRLGAYCTQSTMENHLNNELKFREYKLTKRLPSLDNFRETLSDLFRNIKRVIPSKLASDMSVTCLVCGHPHMETVLDFDEGLSHDRSGLEGHSPPRQVVRCPVCHHRQLSGRDAEFPLQTSPKYSSKGDLNSTELKRIAGLIHGDASNLWDPEKRSVLEVDSDDGSQLDQLKEFGWKTYGVTTDADLAKVSQGKEHDMAVGTWSCLKYENMPGPNDLTAMVAHVLLADTDNPVALLQECRRCMGPRTTLYTFIPQCQMRFRRENAEPSVLFDFVFQEHISSFSAHSLQKAASEASLTIASIRSDESGSSCLVAWVNSDGHNSHQGLIEDTLEIETKHGVVDNWFYTRAWYHFRANVKWIRTQIASFHDQGFQIVGYGSPGILLDLVMANPSVMSYIVDDGLLEQGKCCMGKPFLVKSVGDLREHNVGVPILFLLFSRKTRRTFLKILSHTLPTGTLVYGIVPLPQGSVIDLTRTGATDSTSPQVAEFSLKQGNSMPKRRKVFLFSHFYNEAFLLPHFILHHASMFDGAFLFDYQSTDGSAEIVKKMAPSTWKVIPSVNKDFNAVNVDKEIAEKEDELKDSWKIALTTTEFLVHADLRGWIAQKERANPKLDVVKFSMLVMVDDKSQAPFQSRMSLLSQRTKFLRVFIQDEWPLVRYMHRHDRHDSKTFYYNPIYLNRYGLGRHELREKSTMAEWAQLDVGYITKFKWSPWPDIVDRKLQVKDKIPKSDKESGAGFQHLLSSSDIAAQKDAAISKEGVCDLRELCPITSNTKRGLMCGANLPWHASYSGGVRIAKGKSCAVPHENSEQFVKAEKKRKKGKKQRGNGRKDDAPSAVPDVCEEHTQHGPDPYL